jgi:hypothetical protein
MRTARSIHSNKAPRMLTPQNIVTPLPDITQALQPVGVACSEWDALNRSIGENPLLAAGLLGLAFLVLFPRRSR